MHCNVCPAYPLVEALVELRKGRLHPRLDEALLKRDELSKKCIACHKRARKNDLHFSYDNDGGRLHGEISFDDSLFAPGQEQGEFTTDPDYLASIRRDFSTGCTKLDSEAEDLLRKALAVIVEALEVKDAPVLLSLLKRVPLTAARPKKMTRREFCARVRRALDALGRAKEFVSRGEGPDKPTRFQTRQAASLLVEAICLKLTPLDAPILLGLLKGACLAEIARASGLKSRQTAHVRYKSLLSRQPWVKTLNIYAVKA